MDTDEIIYWDCRQSERFENEDPDEEIEEWLDDAWMPEFKTMTREQVLDALPKTIELIGYKRMMPAVAEYRNVLDDLLESIDEQYGDPDEYTHPTDAMKELERIFIEGVLKLYNSWPCEEAAKRTVVVADWIAEHSPERRWWLPEHVA